MTRLAPEPRADVLAEMARPGPPMPRVDPVTRLPILILYPHSRCNCRCVMCDIWRSGAKDEIAVDKVAAWITEWRDLGVERVVLSGGEPLLHSRLGSLCDLLVDSGMGITLLSTGLLLRRDAELVVQHCDQVVVSLDGPRAVHDEIRNLPRAFAKLAEGVAHWPRRRRRRDVRCAVSARCTVQRRNHRHLRATVAAARELGVAQLSFLAADVSSEAFNRPGGWNVERASDVALEADELGELAAELDALESENSGDFQSGFLAESPAKLRDRLCRYYAALLGPVEFAPVECNAPWVSTVIEADGTVRPCFFHRPLGNIHRAESLGELLNSEAALAWRRALDTRTDPICKRCVCSLNLRQSS